MPAPKCHCNVEPVCAALTTAHVPHMVYHHHHYYHHCVERDARDDGRETATPRIPRGFANRLTPPITTSFFHKETINIFREQPIMAPLALLLPLETVTWRTEVYKYVTRAKPNDPNFEKNGGEIFIIMVHGGTSDTGAFPHIKYEKAVKVPTSIIPMKQYPASNSGVQSGDDWSYTIDFMNVMPMFSNGGNGVFDFEASYKEDFVRSKFKQTGTETVNGVQFAAETEPEPKEFITDHPIIGLSVFKCLDPAVFPVKFSRSPFEASVHVKGESGMAGTHVQGSISKEVTIDFDFLPVLE
ncbi:hypothetical protein EYR38_000086 [Pleurotus pulmonarius]|nr:hypothetical protein EYR38_000086 [Pleurotus pulmonarius]